jgi:hypothetical protein
MGVSRGKVEEIMPLKKIGDLEIDEDIEWERKEWTAERIGWVLMALFVAAALLGLFGRGPLSSRTAGTEGGPLRVEYQRFIRFNSPQELHLFVDPQSVQNGELRLVIAGDFPTANTHIDISPDPESVELSSGRMVYVWQVTEPQAPMQISFHFFPMQMFSQNSSFAPEGAAEIEISQFVYP